MSTRKKITALVVIAIALATLGLSLLSCQRQATDEVEFGYRVIVIDGCEYLYKREYKGAAFAHKGNCKYCAQRDSISKL